MSNHYKLDKKLKNVTVDDHVFTLHEYDVDLQLNHIYLMGMESYVVGTQDPYSEPGIEYTISNRFIRNMNLCMRRNPGQGIVIHMKTCGGEWHEGMAIHNMIASSPAPVTVLNYTHARSMSSLIFQAANKRVMMPDSYFLFHDGTTSVDGTVKQVHSALDFEKKIIGPRMLGIYVRSMKRNGKFKDWPEARITRMLKEAMKSKEDVYLTAAEAVEWGLADEIFGVTMPYDWSLLTEYTAEQLARG